MSMNRSILFIFILYLLAGHCNAQELRATVKVLSPEVQATNKDIFQTLETSMENFLNGYAFTDHKYSDEERIECNYIMTVNSLSGNRFDATLQVQYSRPVYNSNYNSPVLKVLDKDVVFSYQENEPIDFQQNTYTTNLSSILSFYAYTIIGLDRCTFKANGGDAEFAIAQNIVTTAQSSGGASGWKSFDGTKNRFWITDALMSPVFEPVKTCLYMYHRQGLDLMYLTENHKQALETITTSLKALEIPNQKRPNSYLLNLFFDAKNTEILSLYSEAATLGVDTKTLQTTLEGLDRTHASSYGDLGGK
jgi:hypothetical protein